MPPASGHDDGKRFGRDDTIVEGPDEHDAQLLDDDTADMVQCPQCGKFIWAYARQCHRCGVQFDGEAWEFDDAGPDRRATHWLWPIVVIFLIVVFLLLAIL